MPANRVSEATGRRRAKRIPCARADDGIDLRHDGERDRTSPDADATDDRGIEDEHREGVEHDDE